MPDDFQLLRRFTVERSETAFGELVTRHLTLVYSAALRQTNGDAQLARDVAQLVFIDLARKAPALAENIVLAGWLHRATVFAARQILRSERRRHLREQEAMKAMESETDAADWQQIRPLLDDALNRLSPIDRDALLLRFFESQSLAQVGAHLNSTEEAARKRIDRALEKLRAILIKRGVTTTSAALSTVITAQAMQIAPAGLAIALTHKSFAAAGTGTAFTLLKIMTATQIKLGISALVLAGATTIIVLQHQTQIQLREQNQGLAQQITQLKNDNEGLSNRLTDAGESGKLSDEQYHELLKLRGEVGILRRQNESNKSFEQTQIQRPETPSNSDINHLAQQLAMAIAQGDATALAKLEDLSKSIHQSFNTNSIGLNDEEQRKLAAQTFEPLRAAFDILTTEALKGNTNAFSAIGQSLQSSLLKGNAVNSLGSLAGQGNPDALEILLNPDKYGLLLSGTVGALQPAADNGNQMAIEALAAVAHDPNKKPLWGMVTIDLRNVAASGNRTAIEALKAMAQANQ